MSNLFLGDVDGMDEDAVNRLEFSHDTLECCVETIECHSNPPSGPPDMTRF